MEIFSPQALRTQIIRGYVYIPLVWVVKAPSSSWSSMLQGQVVETHGLESPSVLFILGTILGEGLKEKPVA